MSNNANSDTPVFTPANVGGYPYIYLPFENSVADRMGNSVVTATGSMAYVAGKVGTNALNLVNTAGSTANNYVRGTWTGASNFTISFWFNAQTVGTQQVILGAYNGGFNFYVTAANVISCGITNLTTLTGPTITINTWYYVVLVMQTSGVCSMYINNTLSSSATPTSGGWGALTTSVIQIGSQDVSSAQAFNGYIDDLEIYHFAAPNVVNPRIYLPMEGSTTDVMGFSTVTPTGSVSYVPGVVGSQALNLTNTLGTTTPPTSTPAIQYIRASWSGTSRWSVSFWFNMQSYSTGQTQSTLFSSFEDTLLIMIYNNSLGLYTNSAIQIATTSQPNMNTWYYVTYIHQNNGLCSLYLNNSLVGTYNNPSALGTATRFSLGTYNAVALYPFNGYIDDFRIYNYAIAYSPIVPMNWSQTAVSATGQYMLAAASNGGVFQSSNFGASWSQLTNSQIASLVSPGQAAMTINGPTVTPQLTGLAAATWTVNGVTWTASTSSVAGANFQAWVAFNNVAATGGPQPYSWASNAVYTSGTGVYTGAVSTTILGGVGAILGEWIQLQSSTPLTMYSYSYTPGANTGIAKVYYIVGSNDGTNWYPIQYASITTNPFTVSFSTSCTSIIVNQSGTQTITGGQAGSGTFTTYSTTTNTYTYFRLIVTSTFNAPNAEYTEFYPVFTLPMPLYVAPSQTVATITPQLTGLATSGTALNVSWTTGGGMNWVASASTVLNSSTPLSNVFNNTSNTSWAPSSQTYGSSGNTSGQNTMIQGGIGSIQGEWVQIQSSIPLVLSSYQFATGGTVAQLPKTYYIVGSTDGTTWFPIQYGSGGAVTTTAGSTTVPGIITVYSTGTPLAQTFGSSTITTTAYSTAANAYTYFRLIGTSVYAASGAVIEIGEWYINFTTTTPAPSNTSPLTVSPTQTNLAANTWTTANGVSWVASASSILNSSYSPYTVFNPGSIGGGWANSVNNAYTSSGYSGVFSTTVLGSVGAVTGEWVQIQTSVPVVLSTYSYASSLTFVQLPQTYYIVGSIDGINWHPIHFCSAMSTNPFTSNVAPQTYLPVTSSGSVTFIGNVTATGTFVTYPTSSNAYTYFRFITRTIYSSSALYVQIGQLYFNFTAATPNPVNALVISNTNMMVSAAGATAPQLSGLAANTWTVNGVSWVSSASSNLNASFFPYGAFNNYVGLSGTYSWCSASGIYSASTGLITGTAVSTTILGGIGAVSGEWLQIQSSVPLILSSYTYGSGGNTNNNPKTYYIIGSTDGTSWYPIQYASMTTNPNTAAGQSCNTYITVNQSGVQTIVGGQVGSGTFTTYATTTNSYLYFRFIGTSVYAGGGGNYQWGQLFLNFQSGANYNSTNNGSTWSTALTAPANAPLLATAGTYVLTGANQTAYLYSNGITGTYTTPTLTGINANISSAAISVTGQYMVLATLGTTNNVFYSTNYGITFTALTVGSSAITSCAISADGSYITVSNATAVFTLNRNTQGFSIALGNQAGLTNQGMNTIAIGNQAGQTNQSANSIVLNASGAAVNSYLPGFYAAPITAYGLSSSGSFSVLGYGSDSQIVQTGMTVLQNGNIGIGTTNPVQLLDITNAASLTPAIRLQNTYSAGYVSMGCVLGVNSYIGLQATNTISSALGTPTLVVANNGNVGIGTVNPTSTLDINSNVSGYSANISIMFRNGYGSTFGFVQKAGAGSYHSITQAGDTLLLSFDQGNNVTGANGIIIASWNQTAALRIGTTTSHFNGNVGINVAAPNAPLHVIGVATSGLSGNPPMSLINSSYSSVRWDIGPNTNGDLVIFYNNNGAWLGRGNPGAGWNLQSDLRLKDEIEPITHCLDKITALRPVSYRWKYNMDSPYKSFGLIAQEAKDVIPEMVNTLQDSAHGEIYGITYTTCIPILIGAVKELSSTISTLQEENAQMKSQMSSLQAANAATSSQMAALLAWAQAQGYS